MRTFIVETTKQDYEEYYRIRCSPADIFWNGYEQKPDYDAFREIFMERICTAPFLEAESRRIYLVQNEEGINIGFTQLILHDDCIEIGYSIVEDYQGKGHATEALRQMLTIARKIRKRVIVRIRDDNKASQRVAIKNGFVKTEKFVIKDYPKTGTVKLRTYELVSNA